MDKTQKGICALTKVMCDLQLSHIIPKFVWRYQKANGSNYWRDNINPNKAMQDGPKEYLLGRDAEQEFSKRETWFANNIFYPFCKDQLKTAKVEYKKELYYFCISVLWRTLLTTKDYIADPKLKVKCIIALEEWRVYLNGGDVPPTYNQIYMMPINKELYNTLEPDFIISEHIYNEIYWYILRDTDREIYCEKPNNRALFCKIPRFFLWAVIERDDTALNYGLRISPDGGKIDFKRYTVGKGGIKTFIFQRVINRMNEEEKARAKITSVQRDLIEQRTLHDEHLFNSELGFLLRERNRL